MHSDVVLFDKQVADLKERILSVKAGYCAVFLWGVGDYQYDDHCRILLPNSQNIFFHAFLF